MATTREEGRSKGIKLGLLRPVTLFPFPSKRISELPDRGVKGILTVELSTGQMLHDVNLALRFSSKFVLLCGGTVFACGGPEVIDEESMEKVYGVKVEVETRGGFRTVVPVSACCRPAGNGEHGEVPRHEM
mgnify:CR=1 FL=1